MTESIFFIAGYVFGMGVTFGAMYVLRCILNND